MLNLSYYRNHLPLNCGFRQVFSICNCKLMLCKATQSSPIQQCALSIYNVCTCTYVCMFLFVSFFCFALPCLAKSLCVCANSLARLLVVGQKGPDKGECESNIRKR